MTDQEINEAVARRLGWTVLSGGTLGVPSNAIDDAAERIPNYCHSIEAAWEIVGYLQSSGQHDFTLRRGEGANGWFCSMFSWEGYPNIEKRKPEIEVEADTAPMAICQAFLKLPISKKDESL